jgi:hypothetical protein
MTKTAAKLGLCILACMILAGSGCILEEKVVDIVLTGETCAEFEEDHASGDFSSESVLAYGQEINEILEDNDLDRSDISSATVMGGSYEVTDFSHTHDWIVSGSILVERVDIADGPDTLLGYTSQSVSEALGTQIWAELESDGVRLLDDALLDFLNGGMPVLKFTVANAATTPEPDGSNRIVFDWKTCIALHIIYSEEFDFPDP